MKERVVCLGQVIQTNPQRRGGVRAKVGCPGRIWLAAHEGKQGKGIAEDPRGQVALSVHHPPTGLAILTALFCEDRVGRENADSQENG
jgi:hypothetical protein